MTPQHPANASRAGRPIDAVVEHVAVTALRLHTEAQSESDGTLDWSSTTMIVVECSALGITGVGYTYAHACLKAFIEAALAPLVNGSSAMAVAETNARLVRAVRNEGREGLCAAAIAAVDNALWDLKARLLDLPLSVLLGAASGEVQTYASGGFTSASLDALQSELAGYRDQGFQRVKIKVGRGLSVMRERVRAARDAVGADVALMVDANGAYERKEALAMVDVFHQYGVVWFEEPVSSDDLEGLRLVRDRAPAGMEVAAGEYGYTALYFRRMLMAGSVDVLQADATRCAGVTGFLRADALCGAFGLSLSSHCAPTLHGQLGAAAAHFRHVEYFRDHVRMEEQFFEGGPQLRSGALQIDLRRAGIGISLRRDEIKKHLA